MAVRFRSTFSAQKRISEINKRNKENLGQALSDAKEEMLKDIASGKGYDGAAMKELTPEYKAYKLGITRGKNKRGQFKAGRGIPDMLLSGKMLKAMQVSVLETKDKLLGRIFFLAGERDKARGNLEKRKFFGLSEKNQKQLRKTLGIK